jgi:hypothetical protein
MQNPGLIPGMAPGSSSNTNAVLLQLSLSNARALLAGLQQGDVLTAQVGQTFGDGSVGLTVRGQSLTALSQVPLPAGGQVALQVEIAGNQPVLKLLNPTLDHIRTSTAAGRAQNLGLPATPAAITAQQAFEQVGAPLGSERLNHAVDQIKNLPADAATLRANALGLLAKIQAPTTAGFIALAEHALRNERSGALPNIAANFSALQRGAGQLQQLMPGTFIPTPATTTTSTPHAPTVSTPNTSNAPVLPTAPTLSSAALPAATTTALTPAPTTAPTTLPVSTPPTAAPTTPATQIPSAKTTPPLPTVATTNNAAPTTPAIPTALTDNVTQKNTSADLVLVRQLIHAVLHAAPSAQTSAQINTKKGDSLSDGAADIMNQLARAGIRPRDQAVTQLTTTPPTEKLLPLPQLAALVYDSDKLPPTAHALVQHSIEPALAQIAREQLSEQLFKPQHLTDYDVVIPIPMQTFQQPAPTRFAIAERKTAQGNATFLRVDTELSQLGPLSVRLSGIEGGATNITIFITPRAERALTDGLPDLITSMQNIGITAAVRLATWDGRHE